MRTALPPVLRRRASAVAVVTVLTAAVTTVSGCTSGASSAPDSGHRSAPAASHKSGGAAQPPTGDDLASLLNAVVPPEYSVVGGSTTALTDPSDAEFPPPPADTLTCKSFISGEPGVADIMGPYAFSFATEGISSTAGGSLLQGTLELTGFKAGDAVKGYALALAEVRKCHRFTAAPKDHVTLTVVSTVPGLGDQNFYFVEKDVSLGLGPPAIITDTVMLIVRVGNALAGVDSETTDGLISFAEIEKLARAEAAQLHHV